MEQSPVDTDQTELEVADVVQKNKFSTTSTVFGVIGLCLVFFPFVGVVCGLLAISFALVSRKKSQQQVTSTKGLTMGIIALAAGIVVLIGFLLISNYVFGNNADNRDRAKIAVLQQNEKKAFTISETARMGGIDVKVTGVQRHYAPTTEEYNDRPPTGGGQAGGPIAIPEDESEYILVNVQMQLNGERILSSSKGFYSTELNDFGPYYVKYDTGQSSWGDIRQSTPQDVRYVFRIEQGSNDLTVRYRTEIFPFVSPIVGTEGISSEKLTYTIKLE